MLDLGGPDHFCVALGLGLDELRQLLRRPAAEVELALPDADRRGISSGDQVLVRSNGTGVELTARVSKSLVPGIARIPDEYAVDLRSSVEVVKAG